MSESSDPQSQSQSQSGKPGGGCFAKLLVILLLVAALFLGAAVYFMVQPQDLGDLGGRGPQSAEAPARDMQLVLRNAIDRNYSVALTEAEINRWLGRVLVTKQAGLLDKVVRFSRVWVRLEDGYAEVIMEREIKGRRFTVSMFVTIAQTESAGEALPEAQLHGGRYHKSLSHPKRGGRFGRLVIPQGFLILVMPAYRGLAGVFEEEIDLGFKQMARIRIEKKKLVLDPRAPLEDSTKAMRAF